MFAPARILHMYVHLYCSRPGIKRNLDKLSSSRGLPGTGNNQQWKPDFPSSPQVERSHNKFVPMQLRTQPANLPSSMQRQVSNLALLERGKAIGLNFLFNNRIVVDYRPLNDIKIYQFKLKLQWYAQSDRYGINDVLQFKWSCIFLFQ